MREEAHRILYVVVNSVAMNGYSASTRFVTIIPTWINILNGVKSGVTVSFYMSLAIFLVTSVLYEIGKAKKKKRKSLKQKNSVKSKGYFNK